MSIFAQFVPFGPYYFSGVVQTGAKVYHYQPGTTTLKDCWLERTKNTTAPQPLLTDANGMTYAFFDGLYKIVVTDNEDNTLYTWDNWNATDFAPRGEGNALASASTVVLGTDGDYFHVTGSVGIIGLSGVIPFVTLTFDGTPTLTHSGSFVLQGGVNVTVAAGDSYIFVNDGGGVWREVSRTSRSLSTIPTSLGKVGQHLRVTSLTAQTWGAPGGHLWGCTLSNGTDAGNDWNIAAGECSSDDAAFSNRVIMTVPAMTKQVDASWAVGSNQGGLDTGGVANTTYHVWVIMRTDTGVVDALFSTSASAPTMPAGYDKKRRIGSFQRVGGTNQALTQDGDYFRLTTAVQDVNTTNPGTSAVTAALSVPAGINVVAMINASSDNNATSSSIYFSDLASADMAPALNAAPNASAFSSNSGSQFYTSQFVRTNTSRQIRYRLNASDANTVIRISTLGWIDRRGRDA